MPPNNDSARTTGATCSDQPQPRLGISVVGKRTIRRTQHALDGRICDIAHSKRSDTSMSTPLASESRYVYA